MSTVRKGRVLKAKEFSVRLKNRSVLRMLAVMQDGSKPEVPKEFLETGRTGRRNAMPHILDANETETTVADLPARLQQLATSDSGSEAGPSTPNDQNVTDKGGTPNNKDQSS